MVVVLKKVPGSFGTVIGKACVAFFLVCLLHLLPSLLLLFYLNVRHRISCINIFYAAAAVAAAHAAGARYRSLPVCRASSSSSSSSSSSTTRLNCNAMQRAG
ncbi:hypothetical protein IWX46DRAFT_585877 [Phyllosticta citricarpa]|uniref:Uncharacterized protein n=1 Tax=Phyllosticta citricarpa TaxID=55181 RepID=A0ABR1MQD2_9PEZI